MIQDPASAIGQHRGYRFQGKQKEWASTTFDDLLQFSWALPNGESPTAGAGFRFQGDLRQFADLLAVQLSIPASDNPAPASDNPAEPGRGWFSICTGA
jgi:hypothetical protein